MNVFLIDADNLNAGAWLDEAFLVLEASEGPLAVRRAYGSADNLKALADTLRAWAVRPFVNLALTKNTTDIALAVDAMELACQPVAPKVLIIGSGDADFTPLVVRLRERGIRVVCVSERSKMGREAIPAYDRVVLVGPELREPKPVVASASKKANTAPARKKATPSPQPATAAVPPPEPLEAPTPPADEATPAPAVTKAPKKVAAKKTTRKKTLTPPESLVADLFADVPAPTPLSPAPAQPAEPAPPEPKPSAAPVPSSKPKPKPQPSAQPLLSLEVAAILQAVPALASGQEVPLAAVAKALLDAKLRGKNTTATKLLKRYPQDFALLPPEQPRSVQYLPAQANP